MDADPLGIDRLRLERLESEKIKKRVFTKHCELNESWRSLTPSPGSPVKCNFKGSGLGALRITGRGNNGLIRTYSPMDHPELPSEFAKLAHGKSEDILAFAGRYGQLGY